MSVSPILSRLAYPALRRHRSYLPAVIALADYRARQRRRCLPWLGAHGPEACTVHCSNWKRWRSACTRRMRAGQRRAGCSMARVTLWRDGLQADGTAAEACTIVYAPPPGRTRLVFVPGERIAVALHSVRLSPDHEAWLAARVAEGMSERHAVELAISVAMAGPAPERHTLRVAGSAALRRLRVRHRERERQDARRQAAINSHRARLLRQLAAIERERGNLAVEVSQLRGQVRAAEELRRAVDRALSAIAHRDAGDLERERARDRALVDALKEHVIPRFDPLVLAVRELRTSVGAAAAATQRQHDEAETRMAVAEGYIRGRQDERQHRVLPDGVVAYLVVRDPEHPELRLDRARRTEQARSRVHALGAGARASELHPNGRVPTRR